MEAVCGRSHKVEKLSVHTENQQKIIFDGNNVAGGNNVGGNGRLP